MNTNQDYFEAYVGPFCQKNCLFCNEGGEGKRDFIDIESFKKVINKNNFNKVVLTGGEPMMNPLLKEYIKYCSDKNINVSLVTAIDSRDYITKIDSYIKAGLTEIMISLEGPENIHDILVQEKGAFKRIIETLYFLEKNNNHLRIIIHSNINKLNYKVLPYFIKKILLNFPSIFTYHLQMLEPFGSAYKNKNILFDNYSKLIKPLFVNISNITCNDKIKFGRLPLCLVKEEYHKYISQTPQIYEQIEENIELAGYEGTRYLSSECNKCLKSNSCDKFFIFYTEMYGNSEIKPFL